MARETGNVDGIVLSVPPSLQGKITNILEENVVQPVLVSTSAIRLAAETVRSIMKIDDIVSCPHVLVVVIYMYT